jgi:hypothetical protein
MIRSRRIGWVEKPGSAMSGASTPDAAKPPSPAPKEPANRGIFLILVGGGVLALILAIAVIVLLLLPALRGAAPDPTDVVDVTSEPETTWRYDWVGSNDTAYLDDSPGITAVGTDQALVWPVFDYSAYTDAEGASLGWYEGYDEQYDEGYAAGLGYLEAEAAYRNDTEPYTVPSPNMQDYFPEGVYENYDKFLGFQDGFYDAANERGDGTSKKLEPVDPGFTPTVALVNALTGDEAWKIDLSEAIDGADYASSFSAYDIAGSDAVAIIASSMQGSSVGYSLVTLDKRNGNVLSTLSSAGQIDVAAFDGDVIVSTADENAANTTIGRYTVDSVNDNARWSVAVEGTPILYTEGDFVVAYGENTGAVFDGSTGKKATWGDDINYSVYYQFIGDQLVRGESNTDGDEYEIEGWNADGTSRWQSPITAQYVTVLDGSIFTAELRGDGYSNLQRVNPADGKDMWPAAYAPEFDTFLGVQGSTLLVSRATTVVLIDLATGKERLSQKVGDFYDVYEGTSLYYVPAGDELVAYGYAENGEVWSFGLGDSQAITTLGRHLVLIDYDKAALYGLAAT